MKKTIFITGTSWILFIMLRFQNCTGCLGKPLHPLISLVGNSTMVMNEAYLKSSFVFNFYEISWLIVLADRMDIDIKYAVAVFYQRH